VLFTDRRWSLFTHYSYSCRTVEIGILIAAAKCSPLCVGNYSLARYMYL
jgi:hypothetical protein